MAKRIRLSEAEIDALLTAAGAADPAGTFDHLDEKSEERALAALERGIMKLRSMLAKKKDGRS